MQASRRGPRGQMNGDGWQLTAGARERGRGSTCKESEDENAREREKSVQACWVVCMRVQMQPVCVWVNLVGN